MLKKLIKFDNIGLLKDGMPAPAEFDTVTLVYAENGRGKSTLANVLRALGGLDAQSVIDGQTTRVLYSGFAQQRARAA